jgi:hypothetical protein
LSGAGADAAPKHDSEFTTERPSDNFARTPVSSLKCGAMQQIANWLDKLGMSDYAERFAENKVDVSVLSYLTD